MGPPTIDEVAAAVTAITAYLAEENAPKSTQPQGWDWADSARTVAQALPAVRLPCRPTWSNVERLRRAGGGGTGIVGL